MTLLKMSNYGVKIMKKGSDITSSNVLDHIFWSKYPSLNIKQRGTISVTTTADEYPSPVVASINHDFGYKPQFMAFTISYSSQYLSKMVFNIAEYVNLDFYVELEDAGANYIEDIKAYVTDTELYVSANLYSAVEGFQQGIEYTYDIDYLLFMEEAVPLPT